MIQVGLKAFGDTDQLRIEEAERPTPADGEVLIRVHAAGVNRPDLAQRRGTYPPPPGASPILGLEVAGEVVQVGSGASLKLGEKVCALVPGGGYAEYCAVPASHCLPVPEGFSYEEAAGIPETFFTVWANVFQIGRLTSGEKFLVHGGASGIGTTAIQLARAFGATVFTTAGTDEKCAACLKLGAHHAFNYRREDFAAEIAHLTEKRGVDLILDMVAGDYTPRNIKSLARLGRLVHIAALQGADVKVNIFEIMSKRLTITGSTMRPRSNDDKALIARELHERVWPLLERGEVKPVIDRVFSLQDVKAAHDYLEAGDHVGKVILKL